MAMSALREKRRTRTAKPSRMLSTAPTRTAPFAAPRLAPARRKINMAPAQPGPSAIRPLAIRMPRAASYPLLRQERSRWGDHATHRPILGGGSQTDRGVTVGTVLGGGTGDVDAGGVWMRRRCALRFCDQAVLVVPSGCRCFPARQQASLELQRDDGFFMALICKGWRAGFVSLSRGRALGYAGTGAGPGARRGLIQLVEPAISRSCFFERLFLTTLWAARAVCVRLAYWREKAKLRPR
jgi:hypothetical protein